MGSIIFSILFFIVGNLMLISLTIEIYDSKLRNSTDIAYFTIAYILTLMLVFITVHTVIKNNTLDEVVRTKSKIKLVYTDTLGIRHYKLVSRAEKEKNAK